MPSLAGVRHRLGLPWAQLRDDALAVLAGTSMRDSAWVRDVLTPRDWTSIAERARQPLHPGEHVGAAIRDLGPDLTAVAYDVWARANGAPCSATLSAVGGLSWRALVVAAGGRSKPRARTTDDDIAASIRDYLTDTGAGALSEHAYQDWAARNGRVSVKTIYRRFKGRGSLIAATAWALEGHHRSGS